MADGSVVFETRVDAQGFEKGMQSLENAAKSGLADIERAAKHSGGEFEGTLGGSMQSAVTAMKKALSGSDWKALGMAVTNGVEAGVKSGEASLITKIRALASDMLKAVKSTLGISSPSAVFRDEVGLPVAQGIGIGVENSLPDAFSGIAAALGSEQARLTRDLGGAETRRAETAAYQTQSTDIQRVIDAIENHKSVAVVTDGDVYEAYCRARGAKEYRLGE